MNFNLIFILALLSCIIYAKQSFDPSKKISRNVSSLNTTIPENEIISAEISIIDDNKLSAIIICDTLISENSSSAILIGNVIAQFYESEIFTDENGNGLRDQNEWYDDENQNNKFDQSFIISQLSSDIAYYNQNSSLIAQKNVIVEKFDNLNKALIVDKLSFLDPQNSEIIWHRKYGTISSDKSFKLESQDGSCMSGNAFESDIDLNNVKVLGVEGGNYCR